MIKWNKIYFRQNKLIDLDDKRERDHLELKNSRVVQIGKDEPRLEISWVWAKYWFLKWKPFVFLKFLNVFLNFLGFVPDGDDDCPIFGQISVSQIETFCLTQPPLPSHNGPIQVSCWAPIWPHHHHLSSKINLLHIYFLSLYKLKHRPKLTLSITKLANANEMVHSWISPKKFLKLYGTLERLNDNFLGWFKLF